MLEALGIHDFPVFLVAAVTMALTPGQDTFYVLGRSVAQGKKAGFVSVIGILTGALVHLFAGAAGLSALLAASPSAFGVIRVAGGVYLIYLGVRLLLAKRTEASDESALIKPDESGMMVVWRQGMLTNLLNPKIALFTLAFIPQFIRVDAPGTAAAFLFLGFCFFLIGSAWLVCVAWLAGSVGAKFAKDPGFSVLLNRLAGALFVVLGIRLVVSF